MRDSGRPRAAFPGQSADGSGQQLSGCTRGSERRDAAVALGYCPGRSAIRARTTERQFVATIMLS